MAEHQIKYLREVIESNRFIGETLVRLNMPTLQKIAMKQTPEPIEPKKDKSKDE